jgi:hypothetical protein
MFCAACSDVFAFDQTYEFLEAKEEAIADGLDDKLNDHTIHGLEQEYIQAPSWSWASTIARVTFNSRARVLTPLAEIVSTHATPRAADLFGEIISG